VEPTPLADSRVTLGAERDALGMPRVRVEWRLGELEKRTIRRTQEILGEEMARVGGGEIVVEAPREGEVWPKTLNGCWHHMGTTRMHDDPRKGVVCHCRVHGGEPVHSRRSVFPTGGSDMPTITIVRSRFGWQGHISGCTRNTRD
jgi:choline dehydrogenase-like flavoprotein